MDFKAAGALAPSHRTDAFVVFRGEGASLKDLPVPDDALRAAAEAMRAEFRGKSGDALLLHGGRSGRRLLLAGLGPEEKRGLEALRQAAGVAARTLEARGLARATFLVPDLEVVPACARAIVEGAGLAAYRFDELKSETEKPRFRHATLAAEDGRTKGLARPVKVAAALVDAVAFARDLGNRPGNVANAVHLAKQARALATETLTVKVHDRAAIRRLKMGAFAAVAQASHNEPRLIEFRYRGAGKSAPTVAVVGKGVTFDTGGISIKPSAKMEEMKFDMCGAAAVFGLMHAVAALEPKVNLHALVPATDNMPGGKAYRPGDIVEARNGKTIEIISTDAEGRLLLCDALAYAAERSPACIVDLATLTGACVIALGDAHAGLFSNDEDLRDRVRAAAGRSGESVWPLPLHDRYRELMESPYADLKNAGGRPAGVCTAAAFLREFVGETPWAHLDIAGTAWTDRDQGYLRPGATGFGVRLLWELVNERTA